MNQEVAKRFLPRKLIVISGSLKHCYQIAKDFSHDMNTLWLSHTPFEAQQTVAINKATTLLGQQFQALVFNAHPDHKNKIAFDANAFGAVTGTIIGGGYLILLTPDLNQWGEKSYFLQRFIRLLKAQDSVLFYHKDKRPPPACQQFIDLAPHNQTLSSEQKKVFNAMLRVVQGHRRRPLVLTSDRGRGKSTLLGKLAAHLLQQNIRCIIVTAPSRKIANAIFNAASLAVKECPDSKQLLQGLHFLSPDALHRQKSKADLVLVDEAAGLPLPMLKDLIKQHSRLIFASTEHGYEGSGRGFAIRFRTLLDEICPQWKSARLEQPFRWCVNDPLENFTFDALLLKTDSAIQPPSSYFDVLKSNKTALIGNKPRRITQQELLHNESLLRQIFGLLVSAHYQTRPSDLVRLLDDPQYQIFVLQYQNHLIATAVMVQEGGLSQELAIKIYNGKRRPQGHLVPQLLATHVGIKEAPCYYANRIMRIAVEPALQGKGIGSYLLDYLIDYSKQKNKADYIASSFGATAELIRFWSKANFKTVQIGMKRDASSGTHSIIMLQALNTKAQSMAIYAQKHFQQSLPLLLADPLRDLEAPLVTALFQPLSPSIKHIQQVLDENERYALRGFCDQQRGYENSIISIHKLTLSYLSQPIKTPDLTSTELQILIAKVLQKHPWQSLAKLTHITGKKQAVQLLRQTVKKLTYSFSDQ